MKLFRKLDDTTGELQIERIVPLDLPVGGFRIILPKKEDILDPQPGELAYDDDFIYIWNEAIADWKRIWIALPE